MQRIVANRRYGGYRLSHEAVLAYAARKRIRLFPYAIDFDPEKGFTVRAVTDMSAERHYRTTYSLNDAGPSALYTDLRVFRPGNIPRDDPDLVAVVERLGTAASGPHSLICIVEIPDGVDWEMGDDSGYEYVVEKHRVW